MVQFESTVDQPMQRKFQASFRPVSDHYVQKTEKTEKNV